MEMLSKKIERCGPVKSRDSDAKTSYSKNQYLSSSSNGECFDFINH